MKNAALISLELEDMLWTVMAGSGDDECLRMEEGFCVGAMLKTAALRRCLPSDSEMEKLERKVTIARTLSAKYTRDWTARRDDGRATPVILVGTAAMFLLDAILANCRSRALKRLNAAFWVMELADWSVAAPAASKIAVTAERLVVVLTSESACPIEMH